MASTATTRNRFNKQATGDNSGTWGVVLNGQVFDLMDEALDGIASIAVAGNVTLTSVNYATDQARCRVLRLTGSPGATYKVTIPSVQKFYIVQNLTNATQNIGAGGITASVVAGGVSGVICDGVDTYAATLASVVPVASGGTGATDAATARTNLGAPGLATTNTFTSAQTFSGGITSTTGTFSGALSGTTGAFSGAVSGTTGTFSGAVSGTTGTFSGLMTAVGVTSVGNISAAGFTISASALTSTGGLTVAGAATMAGLTCTTINTQNNTITAGSGSITAGSATINGTLTGRDIICTGYTVSASALTASGAISGASVASSGALSGATLSVSGNSTLTGTLASGTITVNGGVLPASDNLFSLGNGSFRFSAVFAATGAVSTSDETQKTVVGDPEEAVFEAVLSVPLKLFQWNDARAEKGDEARLHYGPMAQAVRDAFLARGLDPRRYALYCVDTDFEGKEVLALRLDQFDRLRNEAVRRLVMKNAA